MANYDMPRPRFTAEDMDDEKQRKKIISWLVQLDEKLRYMLENIDTDNLSGELNGTLEETREAIRLVSEGVENSRAEIEVLPEQIRIAVNALQEEIDGLTFDEFETAGSEIVLTSNEAKISTPLFVVDIRDDVEGTSLKIDRDGSVMDYLTVNFELHAPNIVEKYAGPATITLGAGDSIQAALDTINGKMLTGDVEIDLGGEDTVRRFVEDIRIHDITGSGKLTITGGEDENGRAILNGTVTIEGVQARLYIRYMLIQPLAVSAHTVEIGRSDYVWIEGSIIDGSAADVTQYVLRAFENAKCVLVNDILWGGNAPGNGALMYAANGAELITNNIKGRGYTFLRAGFAHVIMSGTRPTGLYVEAVAGTVFALPGDPATLTAATSDYVPDTPYGTEDVELAAQMTRTWNNTHWTTGLAQGVERNVISGTTYVNNYRGVMWFDVDELEDLGSALSRATLKMTIQSGPSYQVSVWAYAVALEYGDTPAGNDPVNNIIAYNGTPVGGLIGKANASGETVFSDGKLLDIVTQIAMFARQTGSARKNYGIILYTGETTYNYTTGLSVNQAYFYSASSQGKEPVLTVARLKTS